MNTSRLFVRNIDGRNLLDIFVVSAVSSILLLRFYLYMTGFPSIGGGKYHIAHLLWGGIFMLIAFILNFAFIGSQLQRFVAVLGGVGFGVFVDEVGKYVTRDNDYFFRPAVGIIYAVFVVLYLAITFLTRERKLTSAEYQLNALRSLEEAIHREMDIHERAVVRKLLNRADQKDLLTLQLHDLLYKIPLGRPAQPNLLRRVRRKISATYDQLWRSRSSSTVVRWFFVLETLVFLGAVLVAVYANVDSVRDFFEGRGDYGHGLVVGQLISTVVAGIFVMIGIGRLATSRLAAFEWFRRATLINLLLTEFFIFSRVQFEAMPGFIFNLSLLTIINAVIAQEVRYINTEKS